MLVIRPKRLPAPPLIPVERDSFTVDGFRVGLAAALLLLLLSLLPGCGFLDAAMRTKGSIAAGSYVAVTAWQAQDLDEQTEILSAAKSRQQFDEAIHAYREGEQLRAANAIKAARHTFGILVAAIDAYRASGTAVNKAALVKAIADAARDALILEATLKALGIKVPTLSITGPPTNDANRTITRHCAIYIPAARSCWNPPPLEHTAIAFGGVR